MQQQQQQQQHDKETCKQNNSHHNQILNNTYDSFVPTTPPQKRSRVFPTLPSRRPEASPDLIFETLWKLSPTTTQNVPYIPTFESWSFEEEESTHDNRDYNNNVVESEQQAFPFDWEEWTERSPQPRYLFDKQQQHQQQQTPPQEIGLAFDRNEALLTSRRHVLDSKFDKDDANTELNGCYRPMAKRKHCDLRLDPYWLEDSSSTTTTTIPHYSMMTMENGSEFDDEGRRRLLRPRCSQSKHELYFLK
mmetsp:Transcript_7615/g.11738  ORF Transcript_7615/g.11738 Transcript_7615/m.11738 type:complete len:248 (+) Transcript_7615:3-746(+)